MQFVRKLVGESGRPVPNIHQSSEDEALSLRHLRKLFMEFLHSPVPLTVREKETKLYMMLPLFCEVFGHAKPSCITEKFRDVCQFTGHVSRLMVNEIRRRAANQQNETASRMIIEFLRRDSAEDTVSGWTLLNTLNILASADTPVVECMVVASLPSNMVKCLYLFYDLPPIEQTSDKSSEDMEDDALTIQKLYTQVLVKSCNYHATSRELVYTDDLALLFTAISCPIPKHNAQWRSCVSEILMSLTRHGLDRDVVHYIHSKSCFAQCLMNMRKIQEVNPLELVEMIATLVCCLKDSSAISHYLLVDFQRCHGYLFLSELLLMLGEMTENEAREACKNVVLLVSSLVMIGHVTLRPLVSIGGPFLDPEFQIPKPIGGGSSVRNIEAFQVLQTVFLKTTDKLLCLNILDCIKNIYRSDNANFFILEPQHTLSLFVEKAPEKDIKVQERIFQLLELVICDLNWVPCPELISVSILYKNKKVSGCHQVALSFLIRILCFDPKYKDVFRDVGILGVLTNCLKQYADALKEKYGETVKTAISQLDVNGYDDSENVPDYPFLLMGCLRLLLADNPENATMFRECGGARCIHNIVPYSSSRTESLKIIRELILSDGNDDLSTLLGLMHSTQLSEVKLKTDMLDALLKVFDLDPRTRAVFREVGGFEDVMSVLINMEGSLADPVNPAWTDVNREQILVLLRTVFHVLTAAIQDDPANKNFMDRIKLRGLSDTIRLLGCFSMDIFDIPPYCVGGEQKKWTLCERRFSQSLQHLPLTASPSVDSVRSSVTLVFEGTLDLDPVSVLYAANEMFKNLFDMAKDSFRLKSDGILSVDSSGTQTGRNGIGVPYIYHGGAVTAAVDLLPAVSKMNGTATSEECLELQLYWICHLQSLLKCEHNVQVMCEAGLPQQILDRCESALVTEEHPLYAPLQKILERLASQPLTPTVLRDVMPSMTQPSSESVYCVESNSDEDEYVIVHKSNISPNPFCTDEDSDDDDDKSESEDTPPQPPPGGFKGNSAWRSLENSLDLDTSLPYGQQYRVAMETSDQPTDIPTAEVDGVDIDTTGTGGMGDNFQEQHQIPGDFQESDQFSDAKDYSQSMLRKPNQRNRRGKDSHENLKSAPSPADQSQFERNKILIRGLSEETSRDRLVNFIKARSGGEEVKDVQLLKNGKALVTMADAIKDFTEIKTKCEERGLDDAKVSIEQVPVCRSILVTGFSDITHDFIELYFKSRRNGGGPVEKVDYVPKSGRAVVMFQDAKDMERVLTRNAEKPYEFDKTQLSIKAYLQFREDEEVDGAEDSGDLGATATGASESRVSQKPDAKAQQLQIAVDPEVMEYVTSKGFQVELSNSLAGKKSEIAWKPNNKMAVIVYRGEDDSDSWQSECIDQVQNYLRKFAKCDVQVNKDFWEAVVANVPSIGTCLGVDPPLVKTIPDSNVVRIVSLRTDVKSNKEKVKSKLEEIYREETRKTYLKKKIPNVPKKHLILLKKIKFAEKLQEKHKELEIKFDTEGEQIYFEGPKPEVTLATIRFFNQMTRMVEKKLNLSVSILEILKSDEGLQTFKCELERNNLEVVFFIEKDATIVGSSAAHADNAARLVNKLMVEEKVQVDEKSKHLLKSSEWLRLCGEMNQKTLRVRRNNWKDTYVTGFRDDVTKVIKKLNTFLKNNRIEEERFLCTSDIMRRYFLELRQEDLRTIENQLKGFVVSIKKGKDDDDFVISGNIEGLKRAGKKLDALMDSTELKTFEVKQPGLRKYFDSGKGDRLVKLVEKDQDCAIKVQENLGRGGRDEELRVESVFDASTSSGDSDDDVEDDHATTAGTDSSTLVIAQSHRVSWKPGNIEAEKADVLVSSQGACDKAIINAGGPKAATPKVGEITVSGGFSSVSHVIHTNCCKWNNGGGEPTLRVIVQKCLQTGVTLGANSIAFPVIGTGNLHFPRDTASRIMLEETVNFCRANPGSNLRDIRFVVFNQDQALTAAFKQEMEKLQPKHTDHSTITNFTSGIRSFFKRKKTMGTSAVSIEVLKGDLYQETTDAIVNITSKDLNMDSAGKLSQKVKQLAGPQVETELNQFGKQSGGTALITSGGNLPAQKIIHLIPDTNDRDHLQQCVERCLRLAETHGLRSISIPAIGTDAFHVSAMDSASLIFKALTNLSGSFRSVRKVRIVIFESPMLSAFQQEHQRHSFSPQVGVAERITFASPFSIEVINGDLTQENSTDAIMNIISTDVNMNNAGDLSKAIARQSGPLVQQECNQLGKQPPGTAIMTSGGNLQVPHIIHIIPGSSDKPHLQQCLEEGLRVADANNFQAISIPCVGTGRYGLKGAESARLTFKALNAFSARCKNIQKVRVVVLQAPMMQEFLQEQKKQPVQAIEEDSDSENAAARQTRRRGRRQAPSQSDEHSVTISVIGKDKVSVGKVVESLKKGFSDACTMEKVESEIVSQLSDKQKDILRKKAKDRDIKLVIEDDVDRIVVHGGPAEVAGIVGEIWKEINEMMKKKQEEEQAKLVSKNIEWSYEIRGTKMVFGPKANGKIELAHSKDEHTVQVSLRGDKFVIDLKRNSGRGQTSGEQITLKRKVKGADEGTALPKHWAPMPRPDMTVHTVQLLPGSTEYQDVVNKFRLTARGDHNQDRTSAKSSSVPVIHGEKTENGQRYRRKQRATAVSWDQLEQYRQYQRARTQQKLRRSQWSCPWARCVLCKGCFILSWLCTWRWNTPHVPRSCLSWTILSRKL